MNSSKTVMLTGDRPTGPLHLGHFVGSLQKRVELQNSGSYDPYIIIADVQALTHNNPEMVRKNVAEVALDYLAVGIEPNITKVFLQSMIPEIAELTVLFMNLVTMARLTRNPTIKNELSEKNLGDSASVGFVVHPISQAADILVVKGCVVPVGEDQSPMIEQTRDIAKSFNDYYGKVFPLPVDLHSKTPRLPGISGSSKMSKSLGNAIFLGDSEDMLRNKVMSMYTDPGHVKVEDPGKIEGNMVFTYLDIFDTDQIGLAELKERYQKGGVGDILVKKRLFEALNQILTPIRNRRIEFAKDNLFAMDIVYQGTKVAREVAQNTMAEVRKAIKLNYFSK